MMDILKGSLISALKTFVAAAIAQIAVMQAAGQDPFDKWSVWVIAGVAALLKGGEKAVSINKTNKAG
jgi:hypothetical protein